MMNLNLKFSSVQVQFKVHEHVQVHELKLSEDTNILYFF